MKPGIVFLFQWLASCSLCFGQPTHTVGLFPKSLAKEVNPDTHLVLAFPAPPTVGSSGKIRIFDVANDRLVDSLDLSIPAGPTERDTTRVGYTPVPYEYSLQHFTNENTRPGTPSGKALPNTDQYQLTIIGGFTDAFHFYPVIVHGNTATIYPHNNLLQYNKKYYVTIDPEVFGGREKGFTGITKNQWTFTTKTAAPSASKRTLTVSADGKADFSTVQGAIDFVPDRNEEPFTILIRKGFYEEIVYFRKKNKLSLIGEDREQTIISYTNDEPFNPHPSNIATNELPGTFPSRRGTFMADNCNDISIANLSIRNLSNKQAEGLLMTGEHNMLYRVNVRGGGDALQVNGSVYAKEVKVEGGGDMILGRGAAFFDHCEFYSKFAFMWIRNTAANHGNVFVNCLFQGTGQQPTEIAREPGNKGKFYPYSEAVLINCRLANISPLGFGPVEGNTQNTHYWEYNSTNLADGSPIDVSKRHPASRQLSREKDAATIANYSKPAFVLGWQPPIEKLEAAVSKSR